MLEHVSILCTAVVRLWSYLPYWTHPSLPRLLILPPGAVVDDEAAALKPHFIWMHTFPCSTVLPILQMKRWGTEIVSHSSKVTWLVNAWDSTLFCLLPVALPHCPQVYHREGSSSHPPWSRKSHPEEPQEVRFLLQLRMNFLPLWVVPEAWTK